MAKDIFRSWPGPGGPCCSAAAAAAAAAFCTCSRCWLAQTDFSNVFRVYHWTERSSSHGHRVWSRPIQSTDWRASQGATFSSEVVRWHCARLGAGSRSKQKHALFLACNLWKQVLPLVQHLKKRKSPVSPVFLSVEGLVHCHPLAIKGSEGLGLAQLGW